MSHTCALNELADVCHQIACDHGFHDEPRHPAVTIALIHSELSEALEAYRVGDCDHVVEEYADVIIRILDASAAAGMDIGQAVSDKIEANRKRPRMHGGKAF